jgi:RIO-like serine/threonine protein kinase
MGVPTRKSRDEIVKALSTVMLVHTIHPDANDYNVICKKLVDKHPVLKDHVGSGYVNFYTE